MSAPTAPSTADPPWKLDFGFEVVGLFLAGTAFFFLLPVLPLLVVGPLQGDSAAVGMAVGTFSITALAIRPFAGWLLDRFGRRLWLLASVFLMVPCSAAYTWVWDQPSLVALRLVHGLAWGLGTVAIATVAADLVPARLRGTGMGLFGLAMPLAMAIGPLVGARLLEQDRFGRVFAVATALTLLAALIHARVRIPPHRDPEARLVPRRMFAPRVIPVAGVQALLCAGFGGWMAFVPLYAPRIGFEDAGSLFLAYAAGGLTSRVFAGRWYDRAGPNGPAALTMILLLLGWSGFLYFTRPEATLGAAFVLGLGFGTAGTVFLAMAIDLVQPSRRGAANATFFSAYDLGIGGGSMAFGAWVPISEVHRVFQVASLLTVLAAGLLGLVVLPRFRNQRIGA